MFTSEKTSRINYVFPPLRRGDAGVFIFIIIILVRAAALAEGRGAPVLPTKPERGTTSRKSLTNNICRSGSQANPPPPLRLVLLPSPPTFALICSGHQPVLPSPPLPPPSLSLLFFFSRSLQEEPSFTGTVDLAQALAHPAKWVHSTAAEPSWLRR